MENKNSYISKYNAAYFTDKSLRHDITGITENITSKTNDKVRDGLMRTSPI